MCLNYLMHGLMKRNVIRGSKYLTLYSAKGNVVTNGNSSIYLLIKRNKCVDKQYMKPTPFRETTFHATKHYKSLVHMYLVIMDCDDISDVQVTTDQEHLLPEAPGSECEVDKVEMYDVLLGRGKCNEKHLGNIRFKGKSGNYIYHKFLVSYSFPENCAFSECRCGIVQSPSLFSSHVRSREKIDHIRHY